MRSLPTGFRRWSLCAAWCAALVLAPRSAPAQALSRVSLDSIGAVDLFGGDGTNGRPDASVDVSSVVRVSTGWSVHIRPWFFKSSTDDSWSHEIYEAALRYERAGATSVRLDAGYITSPIGYGMLDLRADTNPTIQPHLSYFVPLLPFDTGLDVQREGYVSGSPIGALTASYPLGVNLTVSARRWDGRVAVVAAAPSRRFALFSEYGHPAATPFTIAGGGVSLTPGLRVGGSIGRGRYATAAELTDPLGSPRQLTMWTAEAEYAFGYTKLTAEFTQEHFRHDGQRATSATWFVQGAQTLSPRWFVAGKLEAIRSPGLAGTTTSPTFSTREGTAGFRLTPELTLRASATWQRWYTAPRGTNRIGAQVVWSRRWW